MHSVTFTRRRNRALAPAAVLLLALCLLAAGVQALTDSPALVIDGPGRYTLDHDLSSGSSIGVLITSSDVVFDGMGHSITGTDANGSMGINATGPPFTPITNVTIRNLTVRTWSDGIRVGMVSGLVVEDVLAEQNGVGLILNPNSGITTGSTIRDSVFRENTAAGIQLDYPAGGITVERCQATANFRGLATIDSGRVGSEANRIADSDFSENSDAGLFIDGGHFSEIDNSTIRGNGGDGLRISTSQTNITGNLVENNAGTGVDASDKSSSTITGNRITGNGLGVATDTEFGFRVWNNLLNNTQNGGGSNLAGVGSLNTTKTAGPNIVGGPFIGGNFWASPNGTGFSQTHPDLNKDGFCDEPFVLGESTTDFLPLAVWTGPANGSTPFKPLSVPGRVQAEDYNLGGEGVAYHDTTPGNSGGAYRHDDVDIETGNGITDVGWIRNGEYLTYTVNVSQNGTYALTARVASPNSGRTIALSVDGTQTTTIAVPNTGSFDTYTTATPPYMFADLPPQTPVPGPTGISFPMPVTLTAGTHVLKLAFSGDGQNIDWFELTPFVPPTPTPTVGPQPYKPLAIPGTIQAEDYNLGGENVAYHDTTPGNEGGAYRHDDVDIETGNGITNVGWIRNGEFLTYTANITTAGAYTMSARVASPNSGRTFAVSVDGSPLATVAVPNTGSFATFRTVEVPVTLAAGSHTLKLAFSGDGQNLDWIAFGTGTGTTPPTTPAAGGASFVAVPTTAPHGSAVKFTLTPATGKTVGSAWWSFDAPAHLNTWNSRAVNPTFFYPSAGTFSPLVKITYTDGSTETVQRTGYIRAT